MSNFVPKGTDPESLTEHEWKIIQALEQNQYEHDYVLGEEEEALVPFDERLGYLVLTSDGKLREQPEETDEERKERIRRVVARKIPVPQKKRPKTW